MLLNKTKSLVREFRNRDLEKLHLLYELNWAHVYHDSIRGKEYWQNLNLNIGRWAGNYSFFYVLGRILNDVNPESILEFGLGESTKFIAKYNQQKKGEIKHVVVEHDRNWYENFLKINDWTENLFIVQLEDLRTVRFKGFDIKTYGEIDTNISQMFDLYVVDGPFGSEGYSRIDILGLARNFQREKEFIILYDDYNRVGEQKTIIELKKILSDLGIKFYFGIYKGSKNQMLIVTEKYKFLTSL